MFGHNILSSSILEVSRKLQNRSVTALELCEMCLKRVRDTSDFNAFVTVTDDIARSQAEAADDRIKAGKQLGVLDGVPIAYKDNFNTKGVRTTCASNMLKNYVAPYNATVVQRLSDCGAVMIGKTNMDEFAMGSGTVDSVFGPTRNPWVLNFNGKSSDDSASQDVTQGQKSLDCHGKGLAAGDFLTCGGSSGGSAVAVATGSCFGALGSDSGGSTRSPAALCGIVGLKPTYGLVSRSGLIPLCNSLDVPGILTRNTDDSAVLLSCIAGWDPQDSTTVKKKFSRFSIPDEICISKFHIAVPKEYRCPEMSAEVVDLWKHVADILANGGAKVSRVSLPHTEYSIVCYSVLSCCDIASNFARYDGIQYGHRADVETSAEQLFAATRHEGFGEVVRGRILAGNYFLLKENYEKYFIKATKVRRLIWEDFQKVFSSGVDLLLTPVTLSDAVLYSQWKEKTNREHSAIQDYCTQPVNMAGLPAVSIPCVLSKRGLPLSLQLIGKAFQEDVMLTVAKWIEQQMNFPSLTLPTEAEIQTHTNVL